MKRFFYVLLLVSLAFLCSCAGGRDIRIAERSAALEVDTDFNGQVDVSYGGTNAGTAAGARANLGLGNVDNTADADKPISTAVQAALDGKQATMGADDNYVTDAEKVVIGNTSGANTGDQDISGLALKSNVLEKDNTTPYTPTADNHPATKKYVDDNANGSATVEDAAYSAIWNGDLDGTSKNTLHDYFSIFDSDHDGDFTDESWFPSTSGAPTGASYLTTSAEAGLSAETVVSANAVSFLTAADYSAMRALLDLEIGIDVQAQSAHLDNLASNMAANGGKITGSNLATGSVGSDQLSNTTVTPGSYTSADITIDADGRVTAASSGSGGSLPSGTNNQILQHNGTTWVAKSVIDGLIDDTAGDGDTGSILSADKIHDDRIAERTTTATLTGKTIDGDDNTLQDIGLSQTKIISGRFLTATGNQIDADAELYTHTESLYLEDPIAETLYSIWRPKGHSVTLTSIWAESDQTVNFDLQVDDGTPADVNGTDISPTAGTAESTSLAGDTTMADGDRLDLVITSVSGTPTWVAIHWTYTKDD